MSPSPEQSVRIRNVSIALAVIAIGVLALVLWSGVRLERGEGSPPPAATTTAEPAPAEPGTLEREAVVDEPVRNWTELMGAAPAWPGDPAARRPCDEIRGDLARICAALDVRAPELRELGGACSLLEGLAAELAANPPDLASELRSYDTMLDNVFHLFRVAGRERTRALRRALTEQDLAEPAALALYGWAVHHDRCADRSSPRIDRAALYSYAGFLFNTMGGQAYLRRRSPRVEALVCFYALHALDRAIADGHNPQGLDPRPEIARCRELVSSQPLLFAERYAETLDEMAGRWASGRPGRR